MTAPKKIGPGISSRELAKKEIPPLRYAVKGLLAEGLVLLVAKPKSGKSWACLQLALAVAMGRSFLGHETVRSDVLYLALEDSEGRIQTRQRQILGDNSGVDRLTIYTSTDHFPRADEGGLDAITGWIVEHPGGVVIVDTLGRFRTWETHGNAYAADIAALAPIQSLALTQRSLILATTHDNKNLDVDDWEYRISGTQGVAGTADLLVGLARGSGSRMAFLKFSGKDVESPDLIIRLEHNPSGWRVIGAVEGSGGKLSPEREETLMRLWRAGRALTISELQLDDEPGQRGYNTAAERVAKMAEQGLIEKVRPGQYRLIALCSPGESPQGTQDSRSLQGPQSPQDTQEEEEDKKRPIPRDEWIPF